MTPTGPSMDLHVHSTYSDGKGTLSENLEAAAVAGLDWLGMVDHVRADTDWLGRFAADVDARRQAAPMTLLCGVEAKILDRSGRLDLPEILDGVDYVAIADHQVPTAAGPVHPAAVKAAIECGEAALDEVLETIVRSTIAALDAEVPLLVAHLFSVVPKIGADESDLPDDLVLELGRAVAAAGAVVEINERWTCPSLRVARLLASCDVRFVASTDSHRPGTIGRYEYAAGVIGVLDLTLAGPADLRRVPSALG